MIKVLVVDDMVILREGIGSIIERDPEIKVVGYAGNGREAIGICDRHQPDVVLMDIIMPVCDGVEGTRLIKAKYGGRIKVVILTTFNDDENIAKALENGADGYVLKDIKPDELILTVKSAAKGLSIIHQNTFTSVVKRFNTSGKISCINKSDDNVELTERETSIIRLIVDGRDNREIAAELFITEGSVRNMVSAILRKLNLRDRIQLAVFAVKNEIV